MPGTYLCALQKPPLGTGLTCCWDSVLVSRRPLHRRCVNTRSTGPRHPTDCPCPPRSVLSWSSVTNETMVSITPNTPWNICPERWMACISVHGGLSGDESMHPILSNLIMYICLGRGIFDFKDPGPQMKGARDCTNRANGKRGQKIGIWVSGR